MKKLLIILSMYFAYIGVYAQTQPIDTDGDGYYNISTLDDLRWVAENAQSWSWNFELDNDIDAFDTKNWNSGKGWSPIGKDNKKPYKGDFDGHGYKIDGLYINRPEDDYIGFLGFIWEAKISNLGISNYNVIGANEVGGLCGVNIGSSITNSYANGSIYGADEVGGLCGANDRGSINDSYANGSISGGKTVGGLCGYNGTGSNITNSYASGSVSGTTGVGGFCGYHFEGYIINSYSTAHVSGNSNVGGFIGYHFKGKFSGNFWDTETSGSLNLAGHIGEGIQGKTTSEMKTKSTFTNANWDFDLLWDIDSSINDGYPYHNDRSLYFSGIEPVDTDGDGYHNISCYSHLHWISQNNSSWKWNFELDNDIDADTTRLINAGYGWSPIGKDDKRAYKGDFDGHGYHIANLYINRQGEDNIGFFGYISKSKISNLGISNCNVIGYCNFVGGLCGYNNSGSISNSYASSSISGFGDKVGGLCGVNIGSSIINSYVSGSVIGNVSVGGLCGYNYRGSIRNSYSVSQVSGNSNIGGILGEEYKGKFSDNFWDIQTSGIDSSIAGKGKTTAEMKTKSTFTNAGWDFTDIWNINPDVNNGYPFLKMVFSSVEEDDLLTDDLFIYPNPTYNFITIANHLVPNCRVYDINGRLVLEFQSNTADVSGLPKGTYFVIVKDNGKSYYKRFIKD